MKPLREIAGTSLLHRVIAHARRSLAGEDGAGLVVATDDDRIADHARAVGCAVAMTDSAISSGSGRALAAARAQVEAPDFVINLQGDAPFQPTGALGAVVAKLRSGSADVVTPLVRLGWDALDALRTHKLVSPASGTTCVTRSDGRALWFSKAILPAMRDEASLRITEALAPVRRHVGLYGYRLAALETFEAAPPSALERLEGLEQLRLLELGLTIDTVEVAPARFDLSGIDTEADVARAEALIAAYGDPLDDI